MFVSKYVKSIQRKSLSDLYNKQLFTNIEHRTQNSTGQNRSY